MNILWFSWKDIEHPEAGGAEAVAAELGKRLVEEGHKLIFVTSAYGNAAEKSVINGYTVIRLGNRYSVYWRAYRYYKKNLMGWANLVIDEMNTMPFFAKFYVKEPNVLLAYQLCREIWFYQFPFPFSLIGFLSEPIYLRMLMDRNVITESQSTKDDLLKHGFRSNRISIFNVGIKINPVDDLAAIEKFKYPTIVSLGSIRPMKRTMHQLEAFELTKAYIPDLQLKIAGDASTDYGQTVLKRIAASPYKDDIEYLGKVSKSAKEKLLRKSHLILATSVKEGWGLIVTEAASQGTPAVVYDVDGLRDSVRKAWSGLVTIHNTPHDLAKSIERLLVDKSYYRQLQKNAWSWSREFTFEKSYRNFKEIMAE